jgi:hypothetical protein
MTTNLLECVQYRFKTLLTPCPATVRPRWALCQNQRSRAEREHERELQAARNNKPPEEAAAMGKYNALRFAKVRMRGAALALGLFAAACATQPEHTVSPAAPAAETADRVEAVDDLPQAVAGAAPVVLREDAPLRYVVKRGDSLWSIAQYFLRDPWQWPEFWYANSQIKNPHLIYPGQALSLVMVNGHTRLAVERLSPQLRELPLDQALPAIPIDAIRNFLRGPRVISAEEMNQAPYVVAFTEEHLAGGANDGFYAKNLPEIPDPGWAVVHPGNAYRDPDTDDVLGYEAIPSGQADVRQPTRPVGELLLTQSSREVLVGDRLLPLEAESFQANFYPHPPKDTLEGRIISVYEGVSQITQYQIVALNRGSDQGIDPGTVLSIYQAGRSVRDPYSGGRVGLPQQYAGALLVFKVSRRLSYGLVTSANRAVHVLDRVMRPVPGES